MIVNNVKYDLDDLTLPDFETAKKLCAEHIGGLANGMILYLYPYVNIEETKGGVSLPDSVVQGIATVVKEGGGLLVDRCPSLEENIQVKHITPGKYIKVNIDPSQIVHGFHIKEDDKIKWEALVFRAYAIVCEVKKPEYNTDIKFNPPKKKQPSQLVH